MEKAIKLSGVYKALLQKPLELADLETFYIDTNDARGEQTRSRISLLLKDNMDMNQHILFVGYKGCGKSTELKHLEKDIEDNFLVINYSILNELDPNNINYIELIIVTMKRLFSFVEENNIKLNTKYIKGISNFLKTKEIEEIREKYMGAEIKAGAEAGVNIPYLTKFFAAFTASIRSSKSLKTVLKETVEPHFSTLLNHCNDLISQVRLDLGKINKKDLVIIIEDLDKINISQAESLFFDYSNQITSLKSNVIYTFPIALKYNSRFNTIKNYFTNTYELPMIMVHTKNGDKSSEGFDTMKRIVGARMKFDLFENINILEKFIEYSGGCLRDLFTMISDAAENSRINNREKISCEDEKYAYNKIKKDYKNTIADSLDSEGKVDIPAAKYYEVLDKLNKDSKKMTDNTREELDLRQNLTILGYNGSGWCDVHPIMKDILNERNS